MICRDCGTTRIFDSFDRQLENEDGKEPCEKCHDWVEQVFTTDGNDNNI